MIPTFTPTFPTGLFEVEVDIITTKVLWTDVSQGGPSGTYTVTYQPEPLGSCLTAPDDVIYTVIIINECELAVFTIDPLIFLE